MKILIVTGGYIDIEFLKSIVNNNYDYIIAVDKGLESIYKLGIIPNCIVGDFDSVDKKIINFYKGKCERIEEFNPEKDYTDTDLGLSTAISLNPEKITIVGATGTRIDHTLANIHILTKCLDKNIKCEILDKNNRIYLINSDIKLEKEKLYGKYVSLIPFTTNVSGLTLKGFKYNLENYTLSIGVSLGISNEVNEKIATINIENGTLLIVESKD